MSADLGPLDTSNINGNVTYWCNEIQKGMYKTLDGVFQTGDVLIHCKEELSHGEFEMAVRLAGMSPGTARKFMAIALGLNRSQANDFPSSWTVLYELTKASPEVVEQAIAEGTLHPGTTRSGVKALALDYGNVIEEKEKEFDAELAEREDRRTRAAITGMDDAEILDQIAERGLHREALELALQKEADDADLRNPARLVNPPAQRFEKPPVSDVARLIDTVSESVLQISRRLRSAADAGRKPGALQVEELLHYVKLARSVLSGVEAFARGDELADEVAAFLRTATGDE